MDWQGKDLEIERSEGFGCEGAVAFAGEVSSEVSKAVAEALADPIVQALMNADHVAPEAVAALARRVGVKIRTLHQTV